MYPVSAGPPLLRLAKRYIQPVSLTTRIRGLLAAKAASIPEEPITFQPIGVVHNKVREPRISGWEDVTSDIVVREDLAAALDGLDGFSHLIVVFNFDRISADTERPVHTLISGGPNVGTLATRSPLRPNTLGVSVCEIMVRKANVLKVKGLDALDGTPVLDLKPYLPPYDSVPGARLPKWAIGDDGKAKGR